MDWILVQEELDFLSFERRGLFLFVAMKFQPLEILQKKNKRIELNGTAMK